MATDKLKGIFGRRSKAPRGEVPDIVNERHSAKSEYRSPVIREELPDVVYEKRAAIIECIQRPGNEGEDFATLVSLQRVWIRGLEEFVKAVGLGFLNDDQLSFIGNTLLETLSILVYIQWYEWSRFPKIFMKWGEFRGDRLDRRLPYTQDALMDETFFGKYWGQLFHESQNIFIPIVIQQGGDLRISTGEKATLKYWRELSWASHM
jgi:hypothetical protein